jgi:hypothetical protein
MVENAGTWYCSLVAAPSIFTRVTQAALLVNAVIDTVAGVGFIVGFAPHATDAPALARRVASCFFGGAFMLVFVAIRLWRDALLIALPIAYVFAHLADSVYELARSGSANDLGPVIFEAIFLSLYSVYAATHLRAR